MLTCGHISIIARYLWIFGLHSHDWLPPCCTTCPPSTAAVRKLPLDSTSTTGITDQQFIHRTSSFIITPCPMADHHTPPKFPAPHVAVPPWTRAPVAQLSLCTNKSYLSDSSSPERLFCMWVRNIPKTMTDDSDKNSSQPIVLGMDWLLTHNSQINWKEHCIESWSPNCLSSCLQGAVPPSVSPGGLPPL
ncbi:hypothetical protein AMECASPLE_027385 [Ameca splendens]|uniref:Uncharacterized protein n=1 Tax=Ameca splendens TaxID=208324 RepID=A0ABV0ZQD0_9TELE